MKNIHNFSSQNFISNVITSPLKMLKYSDYTKSNLIFYEKSSINPEYMEITELPKNKKQNFFLNENIIDYKSIIELKDVFCFEHGIFDENGNFFPDSIRRRTEIGNKITLLACRSGDMFCPYTGSPFTFILRKQRNRLQKTKILNITEPVFFLPIHRSHYGHFLYESLSRLWGLQKSQKNISFKKIFTNSSKKQWIIDLLLPFGFLEADIIFGSSKPYFIKNLVIASQLSITGHFLSYEVKNIFEKIRTYYQDNLPTNPNIYLSRNFFDNRKLLNEQNIEHIFYKNNFAILYPETMSLKDQINITSKAKVIAGPIGTQLHNIFFRGNLKTLTKALILAPLGLNFKNYLLTNHIYNIETNIIYGKYLQNKNPLSDPWKIDPNKVENAIDALLKL